MNHRDTTLLFRKRRITKPRPSQHIAFIAPTRGTFGEFVGQYTYIDADDANQSRTLMLSITGYTQTEMMYLEEMHINHLARDLLPHVTTDGTFPAFFILFKKPLTAHEQSIFEKISKRHGILVSCGRVPLIGLVNPEDANIPIITTTSTPLEDDEVIEAYKKALKERDFVGSVRVIDLRIDFCKVD